MFLTQPAPKTVEDLRQEISEDSLLELLEKQQVLRVSLASSTQLASAAISCSSMPQHHAQAPVTAA
jgi:hypothetical protein